MNTNDNARRVVGRASVLAALAVLLLAEPGAAHHGRRHHRHHADHTGWNRLRTKYPHHTTYSAHHVPMDVNIRFLKNNPFLQGNDYIGVVTMMDVDKDKDTSLDTVVSSPQQSGPQQGPKVQPAPVLKNSPTGSFQFTTTGFAGSQITVAVTGYDEDNVRTYTLTKKLKLPAPPGYHHKMRMGIRLP